MKKKPKTYEKVYLQEKPYKEWSRSDIYYGIVYYRDDHGLPKLKRAYIIPTFGNTMMKREFLKMCGSKNGKDLYTMNPKAMEDLTDESLDVMLAKYLAKGKEPKRPPRYLVEYTATWQDRYDIVQEEVDIYEKTFGVKAFLSTVDGKEHRLNERGAKVIEVIYNG